MIEEIIKKIKKEGIHQNIKDIEHIISIITKEDWCLEKIVVEKLNSIKDNKLEEDDMIILKAILKSTQKKYIEKKNNKKYILYKYGEFYDIYVKHDLNIEEIDEIKEIGEITLIRKGNNEKIKKKELLKFKTGDKIRAWLNIIDNE